MDLAKPYYADPAHAAQLAAETTRWIGTPFHKRCRIAGAHGGVDCFGLLGACNEAAGLLPTLPLERVPDYSTDWSAHNDTSILEGWLLSWLEEIGLAWERIEDRDATMVGDVLLFAPGRCVHHMGQRLEKGWFVHALYPMGVTLTRVDHKRFGRYFRYALRPIGRRAE